MVAGARVSLRKLPRTLTWPLLCAWLVSSWLPGAAASDAQPETEQVDRRRVADHREQALADAALTAVRAVQTSARVQRARADPGRWEWPLPGREVLVRPFERPARRWLAGHRGVDLRGRPDGPVRSVADGQVRFSGVVAGVQVVSVRHNDGVVSTYQPVQSHVSRGEAVTQGQGLGSLDAQGSHCAPSACLHLGARRAGEYLDPMVLLRSWEVSLLPHL